MAQPGPDDVVLDTNFPDQVSSPRVLDIMIGAPIERLLIFTGIAIPNLQGGKRRASFGRWWVNLGRSPKQVFSYTAVVGLASIGAGEDDEFILAADAVSVELRDDTGELALVCDLSAKGDPGTVSRFAYQASVIVGVQDPLIAGLIRWPQTLTPLLRQTNLFSVTGLTVEKTSSPGSGGFGSTIVHEAGHGSETDRPALTQDFLVVPYVLAGDLPLNVDITVRASVVAGAFALPSEQLTLNQIAGPRPVRLTPSHPQVFGVDFEMVLASGPR
jgi:hypothetical protein